MCDKHHTNLSLIIQITIQITNIVIKIVILKYLCVTCLGEVDKLATPVPLRTFEFVHVSEKKESIQYMYNLLKISNAKGLTMFYNKRNRSPN